MIDMQGKVAVVLGVANKRSIAYAIAEKLAAAGATLVLCYQSDRLKKEAEELIASLGQTGRARAIQLDVTSDEQIDAAFAQIAEAFPIIHTLVHSLAFAPADAMKQDFLLTRRADFALALDISAYSLIAVTRAAAPLMTEGGSIITMTHFGSTVTFPNYNVMGVAKAALEATVRYLAASVGGKNIRVNRIKGIAWWTVVFVIGLTAAYFTYTIGLSPVDMPNIEVLPFIPGIFVFAASHGFRESNLPNTGLIAFFIAAFNACFYMSIVFLVYRWTIRPQRRKRPPNGATP